MTNRAIRDLSAFFVLLFAVLAVRQVYVQLVAAPSISARATNPRHALLDAGRGRILATDGTVLAQTVGGKRLYPLGAQLAQTVGYTSVRYGTSGIEAQLRPRADLARLQRRSVGAAERARGNPTRKPRRNAGCRRRHDDRARGSSETL